MFEDGQLSSMIVETYTTTKVILEKLQTMQERVERHEGRIVHLENNHETMLRRVEKNSDDFVERLEKLEDYQEENQSTLEKSRKIIDFFDVVAGNKLKFIAIVAIIPIIIYTSFVLWFIDPRAIDVAPLRGVSAYLLDPLVNSVAHSSISHTNGYESQIFIGY